MIASAAWQYIILAKTGGGSFRVKRWTGGGPPINDSGNGPVGGDAWSRTAPPTIQHTDGRNYLFAFWSITGFDGLSGQSASDVRGDRFANITHTGGAWTLNASAYYAWDGKGGGGVGGEGGGAVLIDAFDIEAGDFFAEDFVDVAPDPSGSLTSSANDGFIDTSGQIAAGTAITVTARDHMTTGLAAKAFDHWLPIDAMLASADPKAPPTVGSPGARDIVVRRNDRVMAFAFYHSVRRTITLPNERLFNPFWWIETHGGLVPPKPDGPWLNELLGAIVLGATAGGVHGAVRRGVLDLTLKQLAVASKSLKTAIRGLR